MKARTIVGSIALVGTIGLTALLIHEDQIGPWIIGLLAVMFTGAGVLIAPKDFNIINPFGKLNR